MSNVFLFTTKVTHRAIAAANAVQCLFCKAPVRTKAAEKWCSSPCNSCTRRACSLMILGLPYKDRWSELGEWAADVKKSARSLPWIEQWWGNLPERKVPPYVFNVLSQSRTTSIQATLSKQELCRNDTGSHGRYYPPPSAKGQGLRRKRFKVILIFNLKKCNKNKNCWE